MPDQPWDSDSPTWEYRPATPLPDAGRLFTIDPDVRLIAQNGLDDMIDQLGKICLLYYPAIASPCGGCTSTLPPGSENKWITGGPAPNINQNCFSCGGAGSVFVEPVEELRLLIAWYEKDYFIDIEKKEKMISAPQGKIQTKGYLKDLHKVMRANYMLVQTNLEGMLRLKFERDGDPVDPSNIVSDRYFLLNWKRVP